MNFDRETATLVAVLVALAASLYMYNELQKTKSDLQVLTTDGQKLGSQFVNLTHALARDTSDGKSDTEKDE